MTIQMAVFAFGSLLMLVAILGGGFEVKELKVPKVGRNSRLAASGCGMLFIFLGIYLDRPATAAPAADAPQKQQSKDIVAALPPQIVFVPAPPVQVAFRPDATANGLGPPSPPAAPPPLDASAAENRQQAQKSPKPAAPQQAGPSKLKSGQRGQVTPTSGKVRKPVHWEEKPRIWVNRLKGKEATK